MSHESDLVVVNVSLQSAGITGANLSFPMLLSNTGNAWGTPELTRTYTTLAGLEADFATTTPEYGAGSALFGQEEEPGAVLVGKGVLLPTEIKNIAISSVVLATTYKVNAYALGVLQAASYTPVAAVAWTTITAYATGFLLTADTGKLYICITAGTSSVASPPTGTAADITDGTVHWMYAGAGAAGITTNDAIAYNIGKALNALAAPDIGATSALSGSVGSKIVVTTGDAAGNWFALEPVASTDPAAVSNLMALTDVTTDPGVATDLAAILNANAGWYGLQLLFKSAAIVATPSTGASAWAEANQRLLLVAFSDTASATTSYSGGTDALHTLAAAGRSYTAGMWHPRDYEWFDAAKLGYFIPRTPGSVNWTRKSYAGVTLVNFTATQQTNILARRAAFYYPLGANALALDGGLGQVESTTYGFIDARVNVDSLRSQLQVALINLIVTLQVLPNTNAGRQLIATTIGSVLSACIGQGILSPDPLDSAHGINNPFTVYVPPVGTVGSFDPTTRALSGIKCGCRLAGAINSMVVGVSISQ